MPNPKDPACGQFDGWVTSADFRTGWMAYARSKTSCVPGFTLVMPVTHETVTGYEAALGVTTEEFSSGTPDFGFWLPHIAHPAQIINWHYHKRKEE